MKYGIFITGTDTEVGKTFVCAEVVRQGLAQGLDIGYIKPVASGCIAKGDELESEDLAVLREAGITDPSEYVNPIRYVRPASPYQASLSEGNRFDWGAIDTAFEHISRHEYVLVEGIGGLSVPLTREIFVFDLAARLDLPVVIVAANKLGVINHTMLTIGTALAHGLKVKGIILNRVMPADSDVTLQTNADELAALSGLPIIAALSFRGDADAGAAPLDPMAVFSS